jgi:hypothetical protein
VQIKPLLLPVPHPSDLKPGLSSRAEISGRFPSSRIDKVVERVEELLKERIRGLEELTVQVERAR